MTILIVVDMPTSPPDQPERAAVTDGCPACHDPVLEDGGDLAGDEPCVCECCAATVVRHSRCCFHEAARWLGTPCPACGEATPSEAAA